MTTKTKSRAHGRNERVDSENSLAEAPTPPGDDYNLLLNQLFYFCQRARKFVLHV